MLKHIKDIRSPIAVAQQKQAARKASSDTSSSKSKSGSSHARTPSRPPRLQMHLETSVVPPLMTGASVQPGWPDITSPATDNKDREDGVDRERVKGSSSSEPSKSVPHTAATASSEHNEIGTPAREVPVTAEISYAVAIYPYMAEQEDEFDVVVYVLTIPLTAQLTSIVAIRSSLYPEHEDGGSCNAIQREQVLWIPIPASKAGSLRDASSRHVYLLQQLWQRPVIRWGQTPSPLSPLLLQSQTQKLQSFLFTSSLQVSRATR